MALSGTRAATLPNARRRPLASVAITITGLDGTLPSLMALMTYACTKAVSPNSTSTRMQAISRQHSHRVSRFGSRNTRPTASVESGALGQAGHDPSGWRSIPHRGQFMLLLFPRHQAGLILP